jgi:hypothetical protein
MSIDSVNGEKCAKQDVNWDVLISHSESEIIALQRRIRDLSKSLHFFKLQESYGVKFPMVNRHRHKK